MIVLYFLLRKLLLIIIFFFYRVENADTETIIISKAKFKRLCEDSVQLQITKQKIERLESLLNDKNDTSKDSKIYSVHTDVSYHYKIFVKINS